MRISDWSSDVCSSDLVVGVGDELVQQGARPVCPQRQHPLRRIAQRPPGARRDILRVGQVEQRVADPLSAALRQAERRLAEFERRGETAFALTLVYERHTERPLGNGSVKTIISLDEPTLRSRIQPDKTFGTEIGSAHV